MEHQKEVKAKHMGEEKKHAKQPKRPKISKWKVFCESQHYDPKYAHVPFPQNLKQNKLESQFLKFSNIFKQLHINLPLIEALEQMPKY